MYPPPLFESVINVLKDWWPKANEKEALMIVFTNGPDGQVRSLRLILSAADVAS